MDAQRRTAARAPVLSGLAVVLLVAAAHTASALRINSFTYPSDEAARRAWTASPVSPPADALPQGVRFACPFGRDVPRVYWDLEARLDLSRYTSIEIDLDCDNPQALRAFNLYLRSGDGWYVCSVSPSETGRQTIRMRKGDFSSEGSPRGWDRIDLVRISAWAGVPQNASLVLYSIRARMDTVLLVRNTSSSPSPAEQRFAASITTRVSGWLQAAGVPHGMTSDDEVAKGSLAQASVAVLCYNPHPPPKEIEALKRFVQRGGKLIVFYGADPGLAELMHVRLGAYRKTDVPGRWSSFVFERPAEFNAPARVYQESSNLLPVEPADRSARVIAWWESAAGQRSGEPAWVASPAGLWMTHVLLDDDVKSKQALLMGMLGTFDNTVWASAASAALNRVGKIDSFRSYAETRSSIDAQRRRAADPGRVAQVLDRADALHAELAELFAKGRYIEVVDRTDRLRAALVEAYARVQQPKPGEFRGVWDHEGTGWYPGDWDRSCAVLADNGVTAVFPNMLWGGIAHYPSKVLPVSYTARTFGDQVEQCVRAAHRRGLEVHVWKVCWNLGSAPAEFVEELKKAGRLQMSSAGKTTPWLSPSHPDNVRLEIESLKEIVRTYDVDGIHLDYIRYPGSDYCFSPASRAAFEKWLGRKVGRWPADAAHGPLTGKFREWRQTVITGFVRRAAEELRALKPGLRISAAVWGNHPGCAESMGQDWPVWLEKGYVDFVCPMNYTPVLSRFSSLTDSHLRLPGARGRVFPGIGVTAQESQLQADQVIEQVAAARRLGAAGFLLFDLSWTLRDETLPALRLGLTAPAAE